MLLRKQSQKRRASGGLRVRGKNLGRTNLMVRAVKRHSRKFVYSDLQSSLNVAYSEVVLLPARFTWEG